MDNVMRQIRQMAGRQISDGQSDAELLDQFLAGRDDSAFAILVRRHGPMVLGLCLRLLHHRQDAEDAFQATFLTLARKSHLIRHRSALSSWLYRVAFRVALRLKAKADRNATDVLTDVAVNVDPSADAVWRELRPVLDCEVNRLPAKYRAPIVLCYLEGKTYEEAAGELGCPKGTVAIRLLRGKLLLKNRLARRGLVLSAGFVAAQTVLPHAQAVVPFALQTATAIAGNAISAGTAIGAAVSSTVAGLVHSTAREFWVKKLQAAIILFAGITLTGAGAGKFLTAYTGSIPSHAQKASIASSDAPNARSSAPKSEAFEPMNPGERKSALELACLDTDCFPNEILNKYSP